MHIVIEPSHSHMQRIWKDHVSYPPTQVEQPQASSASAAEAQPAMSEPIHASDVKVEPPEPMQPPSMGSTHPSGQQQPSQQKLIWQVKLSKGMPFPWHVRSRTINGAALAVN